MSTLLDKLNDILVKGGVSAEKAKEFIVANPDLSKITLPQEVETGIDSLMSVDAAVSHPIVKSRLRADFLKTADDTLLDRAGKYLDPESAAAIKAETSTYKRLEFFLDKMEELKKEAGKAKKDSNPDEVKRLNDEMATLKTAFKAEQDKAKADIEAVKTDYHGREVSRSLRSWLKDQKLVKHLLEDPDGVELVRMKIDRELATKYPGAAYDIDAAGLPVLGKKTANGLEKYYDPTTNKELNWADFTGKVMAEHKLLAVSEPPNPNPTTVFIPTNGQTPTVQPRPFSVQPQQG